MKQIKNCKVGITTNGVIVGFEPDDDLSSIIQTSDFKGGHILYASPNFMFKDLVNCSIYSDSLDAIEEVIRKWGYGMDDEDALLKIKDILKSQN